MTYSKGKIMEILLFSRQHCTNLRIFWYLILFGLKNSIFFILIY